MVSAALSGAASGCTGTIAPALPPDGLSPLETANARWNFDVLQFNDSCISPKKSGVGIGPDAKVWENQLVRDKLVNVTGI